MRFAIQVGHDWQVIITCPTIPEQTWERAMRKCPDDAGGFFPAPPETELPGPTDPHYSICAGDAAAFWSDYQGIVMRQLPPGVTERFGRYLFEALIGGSIWNNILRSAASAGEQFIELNLLWDKTAGDLHRLNWEMMHGQGGFLRRWGAGRHRHVLHS